ncbi:MAG: DUF4910 domain-containing protein [Candidatus Hydrothermales bacterium]
MEREVPISFMKGVLNNLSPYHRIQVSEGYKKAVSELKYILKNEGINFKIYKLPFKKNTQYFYQKFFPFWKIKKGYLKIVEPFTEVIANYNEIPLSVIPRSKKTYGLYEIVDIEKESKKKEKKILLTCNFKEAFYKVVGKDAGILYYGMPEIEGVRNEGELDDHIHYVSFWEEGFFGFSISPKRGKYLKKILKEGKKIKAEVNIDSEFSEGFIEIVEILLKGEEENREVWLISHLCHPAPFANDNISGVSVSLGIAKYFLELLKNRKLKLKRSLRILLLPEMTGTCAYLSKFFINNNFSVISALNLDMTGEDQEKCKSSLIIEREPHFLRSFSGYLAGYIMTLIPEGIKNFGGTSEIEIFRKTITGYSGGSDHYILISPCFSIPSVMLNYWPDKFYHTTADTVDKVSEISLKNTFILAFTFLYFLLTFEKDETLILKEKIKEIFKKEIIELKIKNSPFKKFKREYLGVLNALNSLRKIISSVDVEEDIKEIQRFLREEKIELEKKEKIETKEKFVLKKIYKGVPVSLNQHLDFKWRKKYEEYKEKEKNLQILIDLISYLSDGKRDLNEIINSINLEIDTFKIENIFFAIDILQRAKFLEII